ncbi:uncharacterized protein SPPG_06033 [Spizellomyces punctatus DAOM BR117]|uniref:Uncharacterized protein n=1 Tax=Spizellomyces punctatus (strain DAOM BR117) TaxID=645134 RepID=A0A0L0HDL6_SPIPD|nr:uncharacterized protein SPPG_06033 [Spizellomyces punctatus DAOM BR117]KNC99086.1 hypothetical protein SPPG_06033 [Spizellomyces punctatus DAOM BR117]|eukprot:XP_016607126.1 hypothetical protein SPPG_06033 [Spizellomyces punctatus DAOM BR117]
MSSGPEVTGGNVYEERRRKLQELSAKTCVLEARLNRLSKTFSVDVVVAENNVRPQRPLSRVFTLPHPTSNPSSRTGSDDIPAVQSPVSAVPPERRSSRPQSTIIDASVHLLPLEVPLDRKSTDTFARRRSIYGKSLDLKSLWDPEDDENGRPILKLRDSAVDIKSAVLSVGKQQQGERTGIDMPWAVGQVVSTDVAKMHLARESLPVPITRASLLIPLTLGMLTDMDVDSDAQVDRVHTRTVTANVILPVAIGETSNMHDNSSCDAVYMNNVQSIALTPIVNVARGNLWDVQSPPGEGAVLEPPAERLDIAHIFPVFDGIQSFLPAACEQSCGPHEAPVPTSTHIILNVQQGHATTVDATPEKSVERFETNQEVIISCILPTTEAIINTVETDAAVEMEQLAPSTETKITWMCPVENAALCQQDKTPEALAYKEAAISPLNTKWLVPLDVGSLHEIPVDALQTVRVDLAPVSTVLKSELHQLQNDANILDDVPSPYHNEIVPSVQRSIAWMKEEVTLMERTGSTRFLQTDHILPKVASCIVSADAGVEMEAETIAAESVNINCVVPHLRASMTVVEWVMDEEATRDGPAEELHIDSIVPVLQGSLEKKTILAQNAVKEDCIPIECFMIPSSDHDPPCNEDTPDTEAEMVTVRRAHPLLDQGALDLVEFGQSQRGDSLLLPTIIPLDTHEEEEDDDIESWDESSEISSYSCSSAEYDIDGLDAYDRRIYQMYFEPRASRDALMAFVPHVLDTISEWSCEDEDEEWRARCEEEGDEFSYVSDEQQDLMWNWDEVTGPSDEEDIEFPPEDDLFPNVEPVKDTTREREIAPEICDMPENEVNAELHLHLPVPSVVTVMQTPVVGSSMDETIDTDHELPPKDLDRVDSAVFIDTDAFYPPKDCPIVSPSSPDITNTQPPTPSTSPSPPVLKSPSLHPTPDGAISLLRILSIFLLYIQYTTLVVTFLKSLLNHFTAPQYDFNDPLFVYDDPSPDAFPQWNVGKIPLLFGVVLVGSSFGVGVSKGRGAWVMWLVVGVCGWGMFRW